MFSAGRSPASLLLVCVPPRPTAAWLLLRSVVPYHSLFLLLLLRPSRQVRLLFLSTSLLSLGYPSPTPPSLFLTGYSLVSLIVCFDALLFSHPTFPSRLLGWPARSLCRLAVRLRFLPPRGFYRSAVFTAPLSPVFLGGSALPPPSCLLPPSLHPLPGGSLFVPPCGSPAIFTAPQFLPLRGFYRSAVFTAPRFLPLRGFYRSAFAGFLGALLFRRPPACCPPVFALFRAHPMVPARP